MRGQCPKGRFSGRARLPILGLSLAVFLAINLDTRRGAGVSGGFLGYSNGPQEEDAAFVSDRPAVRRRAGGQNAAAEASFSGGASPLYLDAPPVKRNGPQRRGSPFTEVTAQRHASFLEQSQPGPTNQTEPEQQVMFVASPLSSPPLVVFQAFSSNNFKAAGEAGVSPQTVRIPPSPGPPAATTAISPKQPSAAEGLPTARPAVKPHHSPPKASPGSQ